MRATQCCAKKSRRAIRIRWAHVGTSREWTSTTSQTSPRVRLTSSLSQVAPLLLGLAVQPRLVVHMLFPDLSFSCRTCVAGRLRCVYEARQRAPEALRHVRGRSYGRNETDVMAYQPRLRSTPQSVDPFALEVPLSICDWLQRLTGSFVGQRIPSHSSACVDGRSTQILSH